MTGTCAPDAMANLYFGTSGARLRTFGTLDRERLPNRAPGSAPALVVPPERTCKQRHPPWLYIKTVWFHLD